MLDDLDLAWEGQEDPRRRRGGPPSRQQRRRRKNERKRKGRSYGALLMSLLLLAVLGGGVYWGMGVVENNQSFKEFVAADYDSSEAGEEVTFTVPEGAGGTRIANLLLEKGIVESRTAFVQACEADSRCKNIQPGPYKLKLRSPAQTVLIALVDPENKQTSQFTITEGRTVIQTLAKLAEQTGKPLADFQKAAEDPAALGITADWYVRADGKPAASTSIEGFLFPDTYAFDPAASAADILKVMVEQFVKVADEVGVKAQAQAKGISPYELLITASIAQVEAKEVDFAKVARVIYNRAYKEEMPLGMDSAENYWLELNGKPTKNSGDMTAAELDDPANPYNTHGKVGMPVGPISNPGKAALQAAANPAQGNWLYFVTVDKAGTTKFAATESEHCQYINEAISNGLNLMAC